MNAIAIRPTVINVMPSPCRGLGILHLLTNTGKAAYSYQPSQTRTESVCKGVTDIGDSLHVLRIEQNTLLHEQRTAHDGAVHSDQRQEDTQTRIQRRTELLNNHLDDLYDSRNNGDEQDETQVTEVKRIEHIYLQQVVDRQGDGQHERNRYAQTKTRLNSLTYCQIRTHSKEECENHVVRKNRADK